MLNVRELTAIGNRWNLAIRPPNVVQNDGFWENDGYSAMAGYRVQHIHAAFLDLAKAFDRVDHHILIEKLAASGLSRTCVDWFNSYMTGRTIVTTVDHVESSPLSISRGVPQGSVLGPVLFIIYMWNRGVTGHICGGCATDTERRIFGRIAEISWQNFAE